MYSKVNCILVDIEVVMNFLDIQNIFFENEIK